MRISSGDPPVSLPVIAFYVLTTAALLWVPLLNVLHAESSTVIAVLAFFCAGLDSISLFERQTRLRRVFARHLSYLMIPFAIYQVARIFIPGCNFLAGVKFFLLFPVVSVLLGVAIAFVLTGLPGKHQRTWFVVSGIGLLLLPAVYDVGLHPQFYVYNHVFGGILGPIYDLELAVRPGLYWFRLLTVLWVALLVLVGFQVRESVRGARVGVPMIGAAIVLMYLFSGRLGINTTYTQLERKLDTAYTTEHFVLHVDSSSVSQSEIRRLAADHEFRYSQLVDRLGFEPELPIHSYLYPSPAIRATLTGAGYTNIAPVWLPRPQVHVLLEVYDRSFAHELAHVFSREMGLPALNSSLRVGLVEGFAVAMEPPDGFPSPDDQVKASLEDPDRTDVYGRQTLAEAVALSLSPGGFWTGRGAVSYTAMGSFVKYLIDEHGIESFGRVYAMEAFESVYGRSVWALARDWERKIAALEVGPAVVSHTVQRFSIPSLFERHCPHDVPKTFAAYRRGEEQLREGDSTAALISFEAAIDESPGFVDALAQWAALKLAAGEVREAATRMAAFRSSQDVMPPQIAVRFGDALALLGDPDVAKTYYATAEEGVSPFARTWAAMIRLRSLAADRPDILGELVSASGPRRKADALVAMSDSTRAALVWASLSYAEAEKFNLATDRLAASIGSPADSVLGERLPAWLAAFSFRAGRLAEAERFLDSAVEAAEAAGDHYNLARLEDFRRRIEWTVRVESG